MKKIFLDTEFTAMDQNAMLISLALVAETGEEFYAELNDFDTNKLTSFVEQNVIPALFLDVPAQRLAANKTTLLSGNKDEVRNAVVRWLNVLDRSKQSLQIWADCYAWDWVLFCDLWGDGLNLPENIHYMPMDLATLFMIKENDPDADRLTFAGAHFQPNNLKKHNALFDARLELSCYKKLVTQNPI